jgi:hypothetical protein
VPPLGFRVAVSAPRPRAFSIRLAPVAAISFSRDYLRSFVCLAQSDFISAGAGLWLAKDRVTSRRAAIEIYFGQAARNFAALSLYSASGSFLLGAGVPGAFPPKEGMT